MTPVAVIMPAFNAARFIDAAIRSLLAERATVPLDIIVIDDASTDATRDIVAGIAAQTDAVRLLKNPRKGIAAGRNTGLDNVRAETELVAFLDSDDLSYPGRIARQRSLLLADPATDVLYGLLQMFSIQDNAALAPAQGTPTQIVRGPYLQSAMYRKSVIDSVGRFDETYRQGDDTDFVLRVIDAGFNLILDDGIAGYYRRHDANVTLDVDEVQREFRRASLVFAARRRLGGRGAIPPIFRDLFLSRDQIEKGFGS